MTVLCNVVEQSKISDKIEYTTYLPLGIRREFHSESCRRQIPILFALDLSQENNGKKLMSMLEIEAF